MDLSKININTLREMLKLSERKEELLKNLKELEKTIMLYTNVSPSEPSPNQAAVKKKSRAKTSHNSSGQRASRGTMKTIILEALKEAGPAGIKIPDLAQKIGVKNANVHVWFSNTGKKLPEIERIGAGLFRIKQ